MTGVKVLTFIFVFCGVIDNGAFAGACGAWNIMTVKLVVLYNYRWDIWKIFH